MKKKANRIFRLTQLLKDRKVFQKVKEGEIILNDPFYKATRALTKAEIAKTPKRFDVINFVLSTYNRETEYLEIGVRNPDENFDKINATTKYSVDPGFENKLNPVDYKLTSDQFFASLKQGELLKKDIKFDVIFVDGLHLAEQVERDIMNALAYLKHDGFLILHDCNPPTNFHASEYYDYRSSPSGGYWNGTTWKAFFDYRKKPELYSCCIDTDWGIGIISKSKNIGAHTKIENPFYEYKVLDNARKDSLGLISFKDFKSKF